MWITVETTVLYDNGAFTGLEHKWTFDEFYTAMAIEGLDKNKDGIYDREELSELAKVNIDGLKEFGYFTYPVLAGQDVKIQDPKDYWLEHKDGILSLTSPCRSRSRSRRRPRASPSSCRTRATTSPSCRPRSTP